jgi:hypothetical protein
MQGEVLAALITAGAGLVTSLLRVRHESDSSLRQTSAYTSMIGHLTEKPSRQLALATAIPSAPRRSRMSFGTP